MTSTGTRALWLLIGWPNRRDLCGVKVFPPLLSSCEVISPVTVGPCPSEWPVLHKPLSLSVPVTSLFPHSFSLWLVQLHCCYPWVPTPALLLLSLHHACPIVIYALQRNSPNLSVPSFPGRILPCTPHIYFPGIIFSSCFETPIGLLKLGTCLTMFSVFIKTCNYNADISLVSPARS